VRAEYVHRKDPFLTDFTYLLTDENLDLLFLGQEKMLTQLWVKQLFIIFNGQFCVFSSKKSSWFFKIKNSAAFAGQKKIEKGWIGY